MKRLTPDQIAEFDRLRKAIAEQEPVRAKAIKAYNAAIQAALRELHDAGGPFFGYLHEAERLHSKIEDDLKEAVEEAEEKGRGEEARGLQGWLDAWEEIGEGMALTNAYVPVTLMAPRPAISELLAKLPHSPQGAAERLRPIPSGVMDSVADSWRRIDAWLSENSPALAGEMNPGATPEAISHAETSLGIELPDAVRASYLVHDGSSVISLFPTGGYYSTLAEMMEHCLMMREGLESGDFEDEFVGVGPMQRAYYHPDWIPVTNNSGCFTFVDLAPAEGGVVGQLINFIRGEGPQDIGATGLAEYLAYLADGLDAGAATIGEDSYLIWNEDGSTSRSGYALPPGAPAPPSS